MAKQYRGFHVRRGVAHLGLVASSPTRDFIRWAKTGRELRVLVDAEIERRERARRSPLGF